MRTFTRICAAVLTSASFMSAATTQPVAADEFAKNYFEAVEAAQTQFTDQVTAAKHARNEQIDEAEKARHRATAKATDTYVEVAQKAVIAYAEARKIATAAASAGYDAMIGKVGRGPRAIELVAAKKKLLATALEEDERARADAEALAGIDAKADRQTVERGPVIADHLRAVVDDFIVDVYQNGKKVPDSARHMTDEVFGATVERIDIEVREGDWLVFNVANNRLRWGGVNCFMAAGLMGEKEVAFVTDPASGQWSYCDQPRNVEKFIADRVFLSDQLAKQTETTWDQGPNRFNEFAANSGGVSIWGNSRNTWLKFVAQTKKPAE